MVSKIINAAIVMNDGGIIRLELYPDIAPETVNNFVKLSKSGFYNGVCFHRIVPNFMVQAGAYVWNYATKSLDERTSYKTVKGEFKLNGFDNKLSHKIGVISASRKDGYDSASGEFFICVNDVDYLDGAYAAFGRVADKLSLEKVIEISKVRRGQVAYLHDVPYIPQVIRTIMIDENKN